MEDNTLLSYIRCIILKLKNAEEEKCIQLIYLILDSLIAMKQGINLNFFLKIQMVMFCG